MKNIIEELERRDANHVKEAREISARLEPSRRWDRMVFQPNEQHPEGAQIWSNRVYWCSVRRFPSGWPFGVGGRWAQVGIWCEDGEARHDWRDFQRIKNDVLGPEWEGIELHPAESRLMDPSNYYMMWCAPQIRIGKYCGRNVDGPEKCVAPQRPWEEGTPA